MSIGRPKQLVDSMKAVTIFFVLLPRASAAGPGTPEYLERLYQWGVTPKPMDHTSYQSPLTTLTEGNTWCPSGKVARGMYMSYAAGDITFNNLGGYPGGNDATCTSMKLGSYDCPCGCGCDCTNVQIKDGPQILRYTNIGELYDGTGSAPLKFDLVIKNVSEYTPWHSGMNGHQSNDGQFAELNLRANTKTKFEFMFVNPKATPQTSYPFNFTDNDKIEVGFDFCFFDFDKGAVMTETLTACGLQTCPSKEPYYTHGSRMVGGKMQDVRGSSLIKDYLCDNIDTTGYMNITVSDDGSCATVSGLKRGTGNDNPNDFFEVLMDTPVIFGGKSGVCGDYDKCPATGISGTEKRYEDVITCTQGESSPGAGVYPTNASNGAQYIQFVGKPYRYTMPKFLCLEFPAKTNPFILDLEVSKSGSNENDYGRNFLFGGLSVPRECVCPGAPTSSDECTTAPMSDCPMPPPPPVGIEKDPHLRFAHGGRADFRGRNGRFYNFLSVPGLSVNVKIEEASFRLHNDKLTVNGSFITEAHLVARLGPGGKTRANVSFWASELNEHNWGWRVINGSCGDRAFKLGRGGFRTCEGLDMEVFHSSASFALGDWTISVRGNHVYSRISGPEHRLDVDFSAKGEAAARSRPHGIVGQSFAWTGPRDGKIDDYPEQGHFTTSAMAEGAIEGTAEMYEVPSAHSTRFSFTRFDASYPDEPSLPAIAASAAISGASASL